MKVWSRATLALVLALALALGTTSCCHSMRDAARARADLRLVNRQRIGLTMQAAAAAAGATLLPLLPQESWRPRPCTSTALPGISSDTDCQSWVSEDDRAYRLVRNANSTILVVRIDSLDWFYTRLARRGKTLVLLVPQVSKRLLRSEMQCECPASQTLFSAGFDVRRRLEPAFLVPDFALDAVERVQVPMVEDVVDWSCTTIGSCRERAFF